MSSLVPSAPDSKGGLCPFCGLGYPGAPNACPRCGTLLGEAATDLKRLGASERRLLRTRKAMADLFFLVGLLLGGPMMTLGRELRLGLFIALAGGVASVLRRYTDWSLPGVLLLGGAGAALVAALVLEPSQGGMEEMAGREVERAAFAQALAAQDPDVMVEARGPAAATVWFTLAQETSGECGAYPAPELRKHLGELGFLRVVVSNKNSRGGLCSFKP